MSLKLLLLFKFQQKLINQTKKLQKNLKNKILKYFARAFYSVLEKSKE